jgi:hypothetical protein
VNDHPYTTEDETRMKPLAVRVFDLMQDGEWRTLFEIADILKVRNTGSIASRLRDFKASGAFTYERQHVPGQPGVHKYRLLRIHSGQLSLEVHA